MRKPGAALETELAELARTSEDLASFRAGVLATLQRVVPADVSLFHELSPRSPLTRAALVNVDAGWLTSTLSTWDEMAVLFGAIVYDGQAHGGVGLARRAFKGRAAIRREWTKRIAPLGVADVVMLHLVVHERIISAVVLGRKRARAVFSEGELETLAQLAPILSVCDAWLQQRAGAPLGMPVAVRCMDGRLTPRQQSIVEQVALGHADHEIAAALQISPHTVRNLLVTIRARLGAANRAEVVHRAVFR
ncbi:MAG TPA: helix-turn-helix transcriptional regulator [Polyangiales bacterium]|nr:helix-turn-helix transcriptional regulator [Polyangiales bacterium]